MVKMLNTVSENKARLAMTMSKYNWHNLKTNVIIYNKWEKFI